jgi:hypothetical protein
MPALSADCRPPIYDVGVLKENLTMKWLLILIAAFALTASAADIDGTYKATADFNGNTIERTFTFKADGAKLTGETVSERMGKSTLMNGKVDGSNVSFDITVKFQDNEMKMHYSGSVAGGELKLKAEGMQGNVIEWKGKKIT